MLLHVWLLQLILIGKWIWRYYFHINYLINVDVWLKRRLVKVIKQRITDLVHIPNPIVYAHVSFSDPSSPKMWCNIANVCIVMLSVCGGGVVATISGWYMDNGLDQTVLHHGLSIDETENVEHEILELLGLPDRPKKKHIHPSLRYAN